VDLGLRSIERALELKPDFSSMAYINLLYREKGKMEAEADKQKLWVAGAEVWMKKAALMREEQKKAEEAKKAEDEKAQQGQQGKAKT